MAKFTVVSIVDGNTIEVSPNWKWSEHGGNKVMVAGYGKVDAKNRDFAVSKLNALILNKQVDLLNPTSQNEGVLTCSVYFNDVDVSQHFPEFKQGIPT